MDTMNNEVLTIFTHFDILYCKVNGAKPYYVQIPRGMVNLADIEGYVDRHIKAGLPSYKEVWSHSL